jgi:hypothetical protein
MELNACLPDKLMDDGDRKRCRKRNGEQEGESEHRNLGAMDPGEVVTFWGSRFNKNPREESLNWG